MTNKTATRVYPGPNHFLQRATIVQMVLDAVTTVIAFYLSYLLWEISPLRARPDIPVPSVAFSAVVGLIFMLLFLITGTYQRQTVIPNIRGSRSRLLAVLLGSSVLIILSFFFKRFILGRNQLIIFIVLLLFLLSLEHKLVNKVLLSFFKRGIGAKRIFIYGAGKVGHRLARALLRHPMLGYMPLGFVDDQKFAQSSHSGGLLQVVGGLNSLPELVKQTPIDELLIAMPSASGECIQKIIGVCQRLALPYKYVPNLQDVAIQKVRTEEIDGIPLFSTMRLDYNPFQAVIKRMFDIAVSFIVMVLLAPVTALIALFIRLDSPGPVIFKQERVGRLGKNFTMKKFRTMYIDTPAYATHPNDKNDPRITRFGRFLRRTSFDELPQLWNVLIGEMSLVGPRPEMAFIVEGYTSLERERLNVKPGITGLWQISADRALPIHANIDHDLYYIQNQSFLLDLIIIGKTLLVPLFGLGAR